MPIADERGARRVVRRFAYGDETTGEDQEREAGCEGSYAGRDAPEDEPADDQSRASRAVAETPEQKCTDRVNPKRSGIDERKLRGAEPELCAQLRHHGDQRRAARGRE